MKLGFSSRILHWKRVHEIYPWGHRFLFAEGFLITLMQMGATESCWYEGNLQGANTSCKC